jgi:hypothetical protein
METNIFPELGDWSIRVQYILQKPYPPEDFLDMVSKEDKEWASYLSPSPEYSTWEIVCQEILDTKMPNIYYKKCYEELAKRGYSDEQIHAMRKFAWLTAGWFNFEKMLMDWVSLSERDIITAINMQLEAKLINEGQKKAMVSFTESIK